MKPLAGTWHVPVMPAMGRKGDDFPSEPLWEELQGAAAYTPPCIVSF